MAERRVVLTQFAGGGLMPYFTDEALEVGDNVIIETNKGKLVVTEVYQTSDIPPKIEKKAEKWLVQKVDMTSYKQK